MEKLDRPLLQRIRIELTMSSMERVDDLLELAVTYFSIRYGCHQLVDLTDIACIDMSVDSDSLLWKATLREIRPHPLLESLQQGVNCARVRACVRHMQRRNAIVLGVCEGHPVRRERPGLTRDQRLLDRQRD